MNLLPWKRRADEAQNQREKAQRRLADTKADWARVHAARSQLRSAYGPDGWTGIATRLFSGGGKH